jgi:tryptophanyl-tRNA synthetase
MGSCGKRGKILRGWPEKRLDVACCFWHADVKRNVMRILSGIQPSGQPHLGNYFGMMRPAVEWQARGECYYFIADYHAMTTVRDGGELRQQVREVALSFLAVGLDAERTVFFRQSAVPEVHELAWYLSTVTPMGLLERCHSFKDKVARGLAASHALFAYPVLMAADILLYDSEVVPVGRDQKQHLEVARDVAMKFNETFGPVFRVPEPAIREEVATIPGLDGQKMSKSYGNTIELFLEEPAMRKKVMAIKTDSTPLEAPKPEEGSVVLALADALGNKELSASLRGRMRAGGTGYGDLKKELFGALWDYLAPFRARRAEWEKDPAAVDRLLERGAERARATAAGVLARVRDVVGVRT